MTDQNFFWIATHRYVPEARQSALSVREHHADARLTLFLEGKNKEIPAGVFDEVVYMRPYKSNLWFLRSTFYFAYRVTEHYKAMTEAIYLDTDTHVCEPLDDVFALLANYDFCAVHAPGRSTAKTLGEIPPSFPEFNIGVQGILFWKPVVEFMQNHWFELYDSHQKVYMNNDQAPLREAIWRHGGDIRIATLPTEFNFRFGFGGQVRQKVRVLHGRSDDFGKLCQIVNKDVGKIRSWKVGELK